MKENELPAVSVCIPTYNNAHFISDALDSVLAQTFTNFECIVLDNCSTDNTREVVAKYLERDKRIKYSVNETNIGSGGNFNRCLQHATGQYVKFLCADDLLQPACIEQLVSIMEENPSVVLAACARQFTDRHLVPTFSLAYSKQPEVLAGTEVIKKCFIEGQNFIGEPTAVLFRSKDAERGFNLSYRQLIDMDMWFHILEKGNFAFTPEVLCVIRQHGEQETISNFATDAAIEDEFRLYYDYVKKEYMNISSVTKYKIKYTKAFFAWKQQDAGIEISKIKAKISRHIGLPLFYFGLPFFYVLLIYRKLRNSIGHFIE
jgi:glycosyltransferase involved in cell wall biosynthesis